MRCILCDGEDNRTISKIEIRHLVKIFFELLHHDISDEFGDISVLRFVECQNCGLRFFSPCLVGSSNFYELLSQKMGTSYYQEEKTEYEFAAKHIGYHDRVLDIGSGRGLFSKYVKGSYTGLDFNPSAVKQAFEDGICVVNESMDAHLDRVPNRYTVITAFQLLEHVANPRAFIESCVNALGAGGLLIIAVPSEDAFVSLQENAVLNMPPHHVSRWSVRALMSLQMIFGIELIALEHEKLSAIHFETYAQLVSERIIRALLHIQEKVLIDVSFQGRIVRMLARHLRPITRKAILHPTLYPNGHSIFAVYKKTSSS